MIPRSSLKHPITITRQIKHEHKQVCLILNHKTLSKHPDLLEMSLEVHDVKELGGHWFDKKINSRIRSDFLVMVQMWDVYDIPTDEREWGNKTGCNIFNGGRHGDWWKEGCTLCRDTIARVCHYGQRQSSTIALRSTPTTSQYSWFLMKDKV